MEVVVTMKGMQRVEAKMLKLLFSMGIIIMITAASLLTIYIVDPDYCSKLVQFSEFWAVARSGGGQITQSESDMYVKDVPLSANVNDLRVFHLSFNFSVHIKTHFWVPVQFIAALSAPCFPIFASEWLNNAEDDPHCKLFEHGLSTPHNITIYYVGVVLNISANNNIYTLSLVHQSYTKVSEKNETTSGGFAYLRDSALTYYPDKGFVFFVADENRTVLDIGFNSDDSWSFSILGWWNVSFEQLYGPDMIFAENTTLAEWVFKKITNDTINVSIMIDNTHYHTPVPAYTKTRRPPWIEIFILFLAVTTVTTTHIYCKNLSKRENEEP